MVKYLTLIIPLIFLGCNLNSQNVVKPEKFDFEKISFNAVSKNLVLENLEDETDMNNMKNITKYWFDNKIKTNGLDGSLTVCVKNIDISKSKYEEYFKISINLVIEFKEEGNSSSRIKTYNIKASEFGEIKGSFSIADQEILVLNIMHQALNSVSKKIIELN